LKEGADGKEWFQDVDWDKTRAFAIGLGGVYLNLKGREAKGIVEPGKEEEDLKKEIIEKLDKLEDDEKNERAIIKVFDKKNIYKGPYIADAPDLYIGYNEGYRTSWDCAVGKITEEIFEDNIKNWSGDHCVDPRIVPGVFFCNRKVDNEDMSIMDIGPTVLSLFGLKVPDFMDGKPLIKDISDEI
jgi:predicted AlkP superfamily phosphohydrolase/phosphomutase